DWRSEFVLTRTLRVPADRAAFFALVRRGQYTAVVRGVYVSAESWNAMDRDERHVSLARAVSLREGSDLVFSHQSAVALWRLPWVGKFPASAHVLSERAAGGRSNASLVRHCVRGLDDAAHSVM